MKKNTYLFLLEKHKIWCEMEPVSFTYHIFFNSCYIKMFLCSYYYVRQNN